MIRLHGVDGFDVDDGAEMTGQALATVGVQLPPLHPESAWIIHMEAF